MNDDSRNIPSELRRRILCEAGHRCAIPTCRHIDPEIHHIVPFSECKRHEYDNLLALCPNCHKRADSGEIDRKSQIIYKLNLRFMHDKFSNMEVDILLELSMHPEGYTLPFPSYLYLLIKRILDANYIILKESKTGIYVGKVKTNPDYLEITPEGRDFIKRFCSEIL